MKRAMNLSTFQQLLPHKLVPHKLLPQKIDPMLQKPLVKILLQITFIGVVWGAADIPVSYTHLTLPTILRV